MGHGFPTVGVLFSCWIGGWECLFVLVLAETGLFHLHAIPHGHSLSLEEELSPKTRDCYTVHSSKLGIDLKKNIGQILIITLHGLSTVITIVGGATSEVVPGPAGYASRVIWFGPIVLKWVSTIGPRTGDCGLRNMWS
ncbi:hypothetical protein L1987_21213 [Smallanthus sonchifolius]|uniref:Uncharacterized protein n=1 Tax=Smallanthus sonchifolius TaxID=185202 RepID=A0ACB9IU92_9ASTR|nr:hypothetical protein L1987_21213 [Smallanthus sonchifolius]